MSDEESIDEVLDDVEVIEEVIEDEIQEAAEPAEEEQKEEKTPEELETEEKAKKITETQKAFNKKHFQAMQAEREAAEYKRKYEELSQQQGSQSPTVPDMPDLYDDDYDKKMVERDQALIAKANYDAKISHDNYAQQQNQIAYQNEQMKQLDVKVKSYDANARTLGITAEELQGYGKAVAEFPLQLEVADIILEDESGPLITQYLASDALELEKITTMSPAKAALYIERVIKPKASKLKPKQTSTPPPAKTINGGGQHKDAAHFPHIKGATFE